MLTVSCSTYKIAEHHLNRKMAKAGLELELMHTSSGDTIEYWDSKDSEKPNLLLVHGFGATTKYQWFKQVKDLSKKYRIIAPNLNYFGRTVPFKKDYSVQGQVELLERFTKELNVDSLTLFGVSYGGLVSTEFAHRNSSFVDTMILFDTPVKFADSADITAINEYFKTPSIEELFVPSEPEGLKKLMFLATGKKTRIPATFLKEFHEKYYAYNKEDKRRLITSLLDDIDIHTSRDYNFGIPVLLVWGSEDKVVPLERGKQLKDYLGANVKLQVIEGAAHMPNLTHTKEFNQIVFDYLRVVD